MTKIQKTYRIEKENADYIDNFAKNGNFGTISNLVNIIFKAFRDKQIEIKQPVLFGNGKNTVPLERGENHIIDYKGKAYNLTQGKHCSKCNDWKPFSEFYKDNSRKKKGKKFGYTSQCKDCKEGRN